jgi:hypothetical protein
MFPAHAATSIADGISALSTGFDDVVTKVTSSGNRSRMVILGGFALIVTVVSILSLMGDAQNESHVAQGRGGIPAVNVPVPTPLLGPIPTAARATPAPTPVPTSAPTPAPTLKPTPAPQQVPEAARSHGAVVSARTSQPAVNTTAVARMQGQPLSRSLFSNAANCWDGVQREANLSVVRYFTISKIHRKYGLTNVLLIAASMFAYASMDNRAVTFPKKSPVAMESLIDLDRTERCLSMANVMLARREDVDSLELKQVSAWRLGLHLGSSALAGSPMEVNGTVRLAKYIQAMNVTERIPVVSYSVARFPFNALRPLDECFYLSRIVFNRFIEEAALYQLARLRLRNINKFLALHLIIDGNTKRSKQPLRKVKPEEVARFWVASVAPVIEQHSLEGVYICAGALEESYFKAISAVARVPVVWRTKDAPTTQMQTTGHEDAAVDLLIAQAATVAMSTERSTFLLAILSRRCPMKPRRTTALERFRNSTLYAWNPAQPSVLRTEVPTTGALGVLSYRLDWSKSGDTTLSTVEHIGCSEPWQGHCFHE